MVVKIADKDIAAFKCAISELDGFAAGVQAGVNAARRVLALAMAEPAARPAANPPLKEAADVPDDS